MKTVQENIINLENSLVKVKDHCMCAEFKEDKYHYTVYYTMGMCIDGARASKEVGKAKALEKLLNAMEKHWKLSGIN